MNRIGALLAMSVMPLVASHAWEGEPTLVSTVVGDLAVYRMGDAEHTVVLWPAIFTDRSIYREVAPALAKEYSVVLIEGPGHGHSSSPPRDADVTAHAVAARQVLEELAIDRAALVGTSWGGMVFGELALTHPQHVVGVAFLNTPFFIGDGRPGLRTRAIILGARATLRSRVFINGVARSFFLEETIAEAGPMITDFAAHLQSADRRGLVRAVRSVLLNPTPLGTRLSNLSVPALVVAGRHDEMYPLSDVESLVAQTANADLVVLDTNHISSVDDPVGTTEALRRFLGALRW